MVDEVSVAPTPTATPVPTLIRFNVTQVSNGYLVETKDRDWNSIESVHLNVDTVVEALKEAFIKN